MDISDEKVFSLILLAEEKLKDLKKPTQYELENTSKFGLLWGNFTSCFNT